MKSLATKAPAVSASRRKCRCHPVATASPFMFTPEPCRPSLPRCLLLELSFRREPVSRLSGNTHLWLPPSLAPADPDRPVPSEPPAAQMLRPATHWSFLAAQMLTEIEDAYDAKANAADFKQQLHPHGRMPTAKEATPRCSRDIAEAQQRSRGGRCLAYSQTTSSRAGQPLLTRLSPFREQEVKNKAFKQVAEVAVANAGVAPSARRGGACP